MNASNRPLGRALLLVIGLALAASGALCVVWVTRPAFVERFAAAADTWARERVAALADPAAWGAGIATAAVAACAGLAVVMLVWFIISRGGGRTATVFRRTGPDGRIDVDAGVADAVITETMRLRNDVLSCRADAYRVRGSEAIRFAVRPRRGADLGRLIAAAERCIADWDALSGSRLPIVLHLQGRGRWQALRSMTRVE
ncbi:hypothetical protein [Microbacterium halotolerans]|uniref:hypothetical protein n=1 Tax=Microbacterium halotolerans TaxID=246613 RepID=UPI000E6ABB34|nr:hypothetical protein [Microbacterium halotolerans]